MDESRVVRKRKAEEQRLVDDAQRLRAAKRAGRRIGIFATEHYRQAVIAKARELDGAGEPVIDPGSPW